MVKSLIFYPFSFKGGIIPSIHVNSVRYLGKTINFTMSDKYSVEKFVTEVLSRLKLIDKSSHKGIHQVWILQNMLIQRLRWPLLIYEISISVVNRLEHKISSYLRKWLIIHHSTTNICLYSSTFPCRPPSKSLRSILISTKVSGHLSLRDSGNNEIFCISNSFEMWLLGCHMIKSFVY